ncbi:MAG: XisH protein [Phycisphaerales bacterium]|nr:XisH protein [Phycisphaerales bacterium]
MPAPDAIHDAVKAALIRDGWTITADPFVIQYEDVTLFADLGAERPLAAERDGRKIVVEVKSFLSPSPMRDLETALGQYELYRGFLELTEPEHGLYLAVSNTVYENVFARNAIQVILKRNRMAIIVVDLNDEEIVSWIS